MYVFQAILIFLKLASGQFAFITNTHTGVYQDVATTVYTRFESSFWGVSWWLILIPTYFIIAEFILKQVLAQTKDQ